MDNLRVAKVDNVTLDRLLPPSSPSSSSSPIPTSLRQSGTLHLTPHHLIFSPSSSAEGDTGEIWISYPAITLLTRLPQTFGGKYPLQIRTRGFDSYVLTFERAMEGGAEDVWLSVKDCAVAISVEQLYAFFYTLPTPAVSSGSTISTSSHTSPLDVGGIPHPPSASSSSGWSTFSPRLEFARQGVGSRTKAWRFTDINKDYSFSPTYPAKMVVPSRISDSTLSYAGKYRSKGRIPALTYLHWANQASMTRSSQPMVGLKNARSAQDERLVECIFSSHQFLDTAYTASSSTPTPNPLTSSTSTPVYGATSTNLIVDARPTANAMANVAIGAGTENMENYKSAKKAYLGIDNIHVMRNSLKVISEALRDAEAPSIGSSTQSGAPPLDRSLLRKSNWLKHVSAILEGSLLIIRNIHLNASHVLVHCSDGWDRTAQLCAVAQICLDPYYRTLDGFKVLVEKDWLAFGHKFLDRSGHLSSEKLFTVTDAPDEDSDEEGGGGGVGAQKVAQAFFASVQNQFKKGDTHLKEVSPVFHQFLDCVRQIQRQFPDRFEYNEQYLLDIYTDLYSCKFGTFLFNNERERRVAPDASQAGSLPYVERTVSAWEWYDRPEVRRGYINSTYDASLDDPKNRGEGADQGVLMFDPRDVRWWFRLFRRGDEEMNGPSPSFQAQAQGQPQTSGVGVGADMVFVNPGQVDPVSAQGVAEGLAGRGEGFVTGPGVQGSRGPSPVPGRKAVNPALNGVSGKGTYRGIESTSSAFSLQTAGHPTPNPDLSSSSQFPSAGLPSRNRQSAPPSGPAGGSGGGGGGWGWNQFSSGAYSALSRGAREIRTIGEGAYNQIRAEVGETQETGGAGTGIGEGRPGGAAAPAGRGVRMPSEANPWSLPSSAGGGGAGAGPSSSALQGDMPIQPGPRSTAGLAVPGAGTKGREPSWNANPWGDDTKPTASSSLRPGVDASVSASVSGTSTPRSNSISAGKGGIAVGEADAEKAGLRHSLADLKLVEEEKRRSGAAAPGGEPKLPAGKQASAEQSERELEAAMGGDSRAWDPLGAA